MTRCVFRGREEKKCSCHRTAGNHETFEPGKLDRSAGSFPALWRSFVEHAGKLLARSQSFTRCTGIFPAGSGKHDELVGIGRTSGSKLTELAGILPTTSRKLDDRAGRLHARIDNVVRASGRLAPHATGLLSSIARQQAHVGSFPLRLSNHPDPSRSSTPSLSPVRLPPPMAFENLTRQLSARADEIRDPGSGDSYLRLTTAGEATLNRGGKGSGGRRGEDRAFYPTTRFLPACFAS